MMMQHHCSVQLKGTRCPVAARRPFSATTAQGGIKCQVAHVAAPPTPASVSTIKSELLDTLQGTDRGIFGIPAAKRTRILDLISQMEAQNPVPQPTKHLGMCHGSWQLLFSTITITGVKRTKLGLREFIKLGQFTQIIDTHASEAVNVVEFSVIGLSAVSGSLTITATYKPGSDQRVDINFKDAQLKPAQLQKLFEANYDLLLSIFNPQGFLDITYLDDTHRVGRDDKGNVFLLQRLHS